MGKSHAEQMLQARDADAAEALEPASARRTRRTGGGSISHPLGILLNSEPEKVEAKRGERTEADNASEAGSRTDRERTRRRKTTTTGRSVKPTIRSRTHSQDQVRSVAKHSTDRLIKRHTDTRTHRYGSSSVQAPGKGPKATMHARPTLRLRQVIRTAQFPPN